MARLWIFKPDQGINGYVIDTYELLMNYLYAMNGNGESSREQRQAVQRGLGLAIQNARRRKGWSREELAERLGVPLHSLAKWEVGTHAPLLNDLMKLLEVLEVTFEELVLGHRGPAPVLPPGQRKELAMCINRLVETARPLLQPPTAKKRKE